jgi:hypothetical protein
MTLASVGPTSTRNESYIDKRHIEITMPPSITTEQDRSSAGRDPLSQARRARFATAVRYAM